jgi:hypothetical protein
VAIDGVLADTLEIPITMSRDLGPVAVAHLQLRERVCADGSSGLPSDCARAVAHRVDARARAVAANHAASDSRVAPPVLS